tara:strand:+ start:12206 stop:12406 length:201 start_codon:yes stop_codon:yes gene_type:complete
LVQAVDLSAENVPATQSSHFVALEDAEYLPAGQFAQRSPSTAANSPAEQSVQAVSEPWVDVPATQV